MAAVARKGGATKLARGSYLTDGQRLVEVRRVMRTGNILVEEGLSSVEEPVLTEITASEVAAGDWRIVELLELADG